MATGGCVLTEGVTSQITWGAGTARVAHAQRDRDGQGAGRGALGAWGTYRGPAWVRITLRFAIEALPGSRVAIHGFRIDAVIRGSTRGRTILVLATAVHRVTGTGDTVCVGVALHTGAGRILAGEGLRIALTARWTIAAVEAFNTASAVAD